MNNYNENEGSYTYYVYMITNNYRSMYYTGVTNILKLRLEQHNENIKKAVKLLQQNTT
ncbi:GIY-YIG nuclease family protein [Winogradskyella sediminis]|uniref:GIY-YIG nuclease family protein n=1 Tax=Winogradskyella sediminis TaxID=1382466 RepID=UPI003AA9A530